MNRSSSIPIALLAIAWIVLAVGCAAPAGKQQPTGSSGASAIPGLPAPTPPTPPGAGAISALPHPSARMAPTQSSAPAALASVPNMPPAAVAQVGYFGAGGSSKAACGCGQHGCGQAGPHGYAMPSTAPWNLYGIDPQEFLCDGGDHPPEATVRRDDSVAGLQLEDTVVHYTTEAGEIEVQPSNRVCLYAPRFSSVRKITGARAGGRTVSLAQVDRPIGANRFDNQLPGLVMTETTELAHAEVARPIDAFRERLRGVPVESIQQPQQTGEVLEALAALSFAELQQMRDEEQALHQQLALAAVVWALDESLEVVIEDLQTPTLVRDQRLQGFTIYEFPDAGRLQICKLADRADAAPGEIVSFAIRVENVGDSAVDHVVLVDNLTTRLEYVEGSQTCSGGAEFEAVTNEGESLKLRWKLTDQLRVGESVTMRFQCKVR